MVDADQFAFIHFDIAALTQSSKHFGNNGARNTCFLMNIIHNTNTET
nr:Uncharacterised protein [Raoultella sp. NCTC 9187]